MSIEITREAQGRPIQNFIEEIEVTELTITIKMEPFRTVNEQLKDFCLEYLKTDL